MRVKLLAILAILAIPAISQNPPPPSDYNALHVLWVLTNPPQPVDASTISAQRLDNPASCSYYYWVVAKSQIGNATPSGPAVITGAACTLVNGNRVSWSTVTGATGYDVLRTSTPAVPQGACGCAIATNVSAPSVTDTGSLSSYTVSTFDPSSVTFLTDDEGCSADLGALVFRAAGVPAFTITTDGVLHQGNCTGPAITGGGGGGGTPAPPLFSVQFNNPLGHFAGDARFLFNAGTGDLIDIGNNGTPDPDGNSIGLDVDFSTATGGVEVDAIAGQVNCSGTTVATCADVHGDGATYSGTGTNAILSDFIAETNNVSGGGTTSINAGFYSKDQGTVAASLDAAFYAAAQTSPAFAYASAGTSPSVFGVDQIGTAQFIRIQPISNGGVTAEDDSSGSFSQILPVGEFEFLEVQGTVSNTITNVGTSDGSIEINPTNTSGDARGLSIVATSTGGLAEGILIQTVAHTGASQEGLQIIGSATFPGVDIDTLDAAGTIEGGIQVGLTGQTRALAFGFQSNVNTGATASVSFLSLDGVSAPASGLFGVYQGGTAGGIRNHFDAPVDMASPLPIASGGCNWTVAPPDGRIVFVLSSTCSSDSDLIFNLLTDTTSTGNLNLESDAGPPQHGVYAWLSGAIGTSPDTGLSRVAADFVAVGNGTASDVTGSLELSGFYPGIRTITATGNANANDFTIRCDATAGAVTLTLLASPTRGQLVNIKKIDSSVNSCTVSGNGHNIDGSASQSTTTQFFSYQLQYDATSATWNIL